MQTFKVLSALLSYPSAEMHSALPEMAAAIQYEALLPAQQQGMVLDFIERLQQRDLIQLQECYVELFDRGRKLSLHIFEHVHGESRDRGQAMVDLMEHYRACGFQLDAPELPDYIPVLLEFLSRRPLDESRLLLSDALPVLALIGERLRNRDSDYYVLFDALVGVAGPVEEMAAIRAEVASEGPDEALVNMDKIWEEEAVTFMQGPADCQRQGAGQQAADDVTPVRWVTHPQAAAGQRTTNGG